MKKYLFSYMLAVLTLLQVVQPAHAVWGWQSVVSSATGVVGWMKTNKKTTALGVAAVGVGVLAWQAYKRFSEAQQNMGDDDFDTADTFDQDNGSEKQDSECDHECCEDTFMASKNALFEDQDEPLNFSMQSSSDSGSDSDDDDNFEDEEITVIGGAPSVPFFSDTASYMPDETRPDVQYDLIRRVNVFGSQDDLQGQEDPLQLIEEGSEEIWGDESGQYKSPISELQKPQQSFEDQLRDAREKKAAELASKRQEEAHTEEETPVINSILQDPLLYQQREARIADQKKRAEEQKRAQDKAYNKHRLVWSLKNKDSGLLQRVLSDLGDYTHDDEIQEILSEGAQNYYQQQRDTVTLSEEYNVLQSLCGIVLNKLTYETKNKFLQEVMVPPILDDYFNKIQNMFASGDIGLLDQCFLHAFNTYPLDKNNDGGLFQQFKDKVLNLVVVRAYQIEAKMTVDENDRTEISMTVDENDRTEIPILKVILDQGSDENKEQAQRLWAIYLNSAPIAQPGDFGQARQNPNLEQVTQAEQDAAYARALAEEQEAEAEQE